MVTRARGGGRKARLSRERVLEAAVAIADEAGLEAMTMQRIGERLGVEAMSLYRHVRNKDDLIDGIVDIVYGEIEVPVDEPDWRLAMRRRADSTRAALTRHAWATVLMESRAQPGPANLRHRDETLGILRRAGFSSAMATHANNLLDSYVYGFALQEATLPVATPELMQEMGEAILARWTGDEYPDLKAVATDLLAGGFDYGDEFPFGLDLILEGLDRLPKT